MIVLFFDLTSLQADDLIRSTRAAEKYIREQMTPADLVGVMAFGNTLKVVANFTNDRDLLQQSVEALVPGHEAALAGAGRCSDDGEWAKHPSPKIPARLSLPTIPSSTSSTPTGNLPPWKRSARFLKIFPARNP